MTKALSDAQQRALLAMPINGPYGAQGYGWWRERGEVMQLAGPHVPARTVEILVEHGLLERDGPKLLLVRLTPAGRARRIEVWRKRK